MSYNLIKSIHEQLMREISSPRVFPYSYGTCGSLLCSLMIPVFGTQALTYIQNDLGQMELNVDEGSIPDLQNYLDHFNDPLLSEVSSAVFNFINEEYLGILKNFFHEEVWHIDSALSTVLEGKEEFCDSILLFVYSLPVFPVSNTMREFLVDFHVFENDETYVEIQSILNEFFNETPKCQRHYLAWKQVESLPQEKREEVLARLESAIPFTCDGCGKDIKGLKAPYIGRIEIYPSRNLRFKEEDEFASKEEFEEEMGNLYEMTRSKPEKELTKEIWTEYRLFLCADCRATFISRIEGGEFI
ncbi:MAG: hypothetical protein JW774_11455 [Candidatus Aureabacteria bacterium]|nr:hypothetical protein [Candidatus Auribacterota bacterium]